MSRPLTFGSLFAGVGGFDRGFERAGMICKWQVDLYRPEMIPSLVAEYEEKLSWATAKEAERIKRDWRDLKRAGQGLEFIGRKRFPDVHRINGVQNAGAKTLKSVDIICGGFPCQDISLAGGRKGLAGERSGLWFEFLRVIEELEPRWVLIENVPGLLSSSGGWDMGTILGGLAKCGYWWAYRVLNAQYFGVPQRRRRVFIVGCLGVGCAQELLFERESSPWDIAPGEEERAEITPPLTRSPHADGAAEEGRLIAFSGGNSSRSWGLGLSYDCAPPLRAGDGGNGIPVISLCNRDGRTGQVTETLRAKSHGAVPIVATALNSGGNSGGFRTEPGEHLVVWDNGQGDPNAEEGDLAYCLNGQANQGIGVRRLMPIECERLQGFPDNWTAGQSDTARYRQLGNAVAVPVGQWIGERIVRVNDLHFT